MGLLCPEKVSGFPEPLLEWENPSLAKNLVDSLCSKAQRG